MNTTDWDAIARRYSIPSGIAYLNNGSFGPVPTAAIEASVALLRDLESNPQEYLAAYRERTPGVKASLGTFLGMRAEDFVFVTNVTVAMNMIARGLRSLAPGDEILLTDQEYGAVDKTWQFVAAKRGASIARAPLPAPARTPGELYDAVVSAITPRTRIISISHITSPTGVILPVRAVCAEARRRGVLTAVDGAHAPGMIPLDIESFGADFYAGNCHKWLGAPKGVGFLWVSPQAQSL
ncbi:MAG TPA: aminotransferase class V-fold PLP-dependent enzyme, partial [Spirochaetia bacterium]|nr:aminotransferase class V-fold PLP-dependent enzyme [Spirochaetia bacterium]